MRQIDNRLRRLERQNAARRLKQVVLWDDGSGSAQIEARREYRDCSRWMAPGSMRNLAMRGKVSATGRANPSQAQPMFSPNFRFLLTVRLP